MASTDREILLVLYRSTDGPNWENKTNWDTDAALGEWYGVKVDDEGRVVELSLPGNNLRGMLVKAYQYIDKVFPAHTTFCSLDLSLETANRKWSLNDKGSQNVFFVVHIPPRSARGLRLSAPFMCIGRRTSSLCGRCCWTRQKLSPSEKHKY